MNERTYARRLMLLPCLGAIFSLVRCTVALNSDLVRELRQKSMDRGLALARVRGPLADIVPFDADPIRRDCVPEVDPPSFSGDGSKVIWPDNTGFTIRTVSGSLIGRVKVTLPNMHAVVLSPDGRQLAFESTHADAGPPETGLYVLNLDSDRPILLESDTHHAGIAPGFSKSIGWSPDSQSIVYARAGQVFILDVQSRKQLLLAPGTSPSWSPDGKWIAYKAENDSGKLIAPNGTEPKSPISSHRIVDYLHWSPDSEYVMFGETFTPGPIEFFKRPFGSSVRLSIFRIRDGAIQSVFWFGPKGGSDLDFGWIYAYREFCNAPVGS